MQSLPRLLPIFVSVASLLAELPVAAATPCPVHKKAVLGLMPAACGGGEGITQLAVVPHNNYG